MKRSDPSLKRSDPSTSSSTSTNDRTQPKKRAKLEPELTDHTLKKIISGGQNGADLGGLKGGKSAGLKTGGTAPKDYKTRPKNVDIDSNSCDAGKQAAQELIEYGLKQHTSSSYPPRSRSNVDNSDGTVAFKDPRITSWGTQLTITYAETGRWRGKKYREITKPVLILSPRDKIVDNAEKLKAFILKNNIQTLNVAGQREHSCRGIENHVSKVIQEAYI